MRDNTVVIKEVRKTTNNMRLITWSHSWRTLNLSVFNCLLTVNYHLRKSHIHRLHHGDYQKRPRCSSEWSCAISSLESAQRTRSLRFFISYSHGMPSSLPVVVIFDLRTRRNHPFFLVLRRMRCTLFFAPPWSRCISHFLNKPSGCLCLFSKSFPKTKYYHRLTQMRSSTGRKCNTQFSLGLWYETSRSGIFSSYRFCQDYIEEHDNGPHSPITESITLLNTYFDSWKQERSCVNILSDYMQHVFPQLR